MRQEEVRPSILLSHLMSTMRGPVQRMVDSQIWSRISAGRYGMRWLALLFCVDGVNVRLARASSILWYCRLEELDLKV